MKRLILLLGAFGGAAATFFLLRGGGELAQMKDKAKRAVSNAENEFDNLYPSDKDYPPARAARA